MNVHHLELFYYVARHGGISEAVRNIPYGIQQPAVSGQIIQLEEFLGTPLFQRRPFALTPAGKELFDYIEPFFSRLNVVATKLQGGTAHHIRIGASEIVLRDHLPELVQNVRKKFPKLKITLRESHQPQLEAWLERGEIDLAVTLVNGKTPAGLHSQTLVKLPLVLLVPKESPLKSASELWKRDRIDESLICLAPNEIVCREFQTQLAKLGVDWFPSIEVSSLNLIAAYVKNGYGIGLSVEVPGVPFPPEVRAIALPEFPAMTVGAMWRGKATPLAQAFVDELAKRAKQLN
ncbi:MAG: Transcriptional regulator, LysR family [Verrucomicrobiales bacterium]|nr:Transcriptional regulator, LysR family [Verrucomicrobiales bacterium]